MKRPTMLLRRILLDVRLQPEHTIDRDYREICSRYQREGLSFLTITLPRLDDVLLKGLSSGHISRADFEGFKPFKKRGSLPALLQGFFRCIFDDDGWLLSSPNVDAIYAIRQVSRLFKKVEKPCSDRRIRAAYRRYEDNDQSINWNSNRCAIDTSILASVSGYLWSDLEELSGKLYCFPGIFGSGATAGREKRNERFTVTKWPTRSETSFPAIFHAVHNESEPLTGIRFLALDEEEPVRVVQVPKTLKTPRTISVEPSYTMLMQQSIAKPLMSYLESKRFGFRSIRFTDQSVNREWARRGSLDGSIATIDLSDASDLVPLGAVQEIFKVCPAFLQLIEDCRTRTALLPDGRIIDLKKFSSMGSALCFPVESMYFFTIVMYSLVRQSGKRPSRRYLQKLASRVAIYGDDILVDSSMASGVEADLEAFGLKVNRDKSFHTGFFRESCGGDYYRGVDVTPLYVRQWDDTGQLNDPVMRVAQVALSNSFYMKGLWNACDYLRTELVRRMGRIPYSRVPIGIIHFASFIRSDNLSWDSNLHGYRVKGISLVPKRVVDSPTSLAGNLIGTFGDRYHADSRSAFKQFCSETSNSGASTYDPMWSCEQEVPEFEGSMGTELRYFRNGGLSCVTRGCHSYSDIVSSGLHWKEWSKHLAVSRPRSMVFSERPYALNSKRRWTTSPVGLDW